MGTLIAAVAVAVFFYGLFPAIGAFIVRRSWRRFRKDLLGLSRSPFLTYGAIRAMGAEDRNRFRFFGSLEAIEGDDVLWIRSPELAVAVDMRRVTVYRIPAALSPEATNVEELKDIFTGEPPERIPWNRLFSLSAGTRLFVGGMVRADNGKPVFVSTPEVPLTVILYDGDRSAMLRRCIWSGRQRNEYWNRVTPPSLAVGFSILSILLLGNLQADGPLLVTLVTLELAFLPVVPFLPPGVAMLAGYRHLWKHARDLRADRDLLALPMRYFPAGTEPPASVILPDGTIYVFRRLTPLEKFDLTRTVPVRTADLLYGAAGRTDAEGTDAVPIRRGDQQSGIADDYVYFGVMKRPETGEAAQGPVADPVPDTRQDLADPDFLATAPLDRPEDPMAEYLIIPGNPLELSRACARKARLFEIMAGIVFGIGIAANMALVFMILVALVK